MNLVKECRHSQRNESSTNKDRKSHTAMKTAHTGVHLLLSLKCLGQRTESYSPMAGKSNAANLSHSRSNAPHPGCLHLQVRGKIQSHQFIAINQFFDSTSFTILLTASVIPQSPTKPRIYHIHSDACSRVSLFVTWQNVNIWFQILSGDANLLHHPTQPPIIIDRQTNLQWI